MSTRRERIAMMFDPRYKDYAMIGVMPDKKEKSIGSQRALSADEAIERYTQEDMDDLGIVAVRAVEKVKENV